MTTDELPKHGHEQSDWIWAVSKGFNTGTYNIPEGSSGNATTYADGKDTQRTWTQISGNDAPHSNVQPVIASYGWKRTA